MEGFDRMTLRTFLALPLGELFVQEIDQFLEQTRSQERKEIRWVSPSQIHVTLHFFGPTAKEEIEKIRDAASTAAAGCPPLNVCLEELGCFPSPERPRVIWMGVGGHAERLVELQSEIENNLSDAGFPVESRTFIPHATIGRVKKEGGRISLPWDRLKFEKTELKTLDRIVLFQSLLSPQGACYEALETFHLSGKPYPEAA